MTPLEQDDDTAIIFDAGVNGDDRSTTLWIEYAVGLTPSRMSFDLKSPDLQAQQRGQDGFKILRRELGLQTVNCPSDLLNKELSRCAVSEIETAMDDTRKAPPRPLREQRGRFVYVISCQEGGICKIGVASSPERRLATLSTSSPYQLQLEATRFFDNPHAVESAAHHHFRRKRLNGEWFRIAVDEAVAFVNSQARKNEDINRAA